jgi:hypothetical protein
MYLDNFYQIKYNLFIIDITDANFNVILKTIFDVYLLKLILFFIYLKYGNYFTDSL